MVFNIVCAWCKRQIGTKEVPGEHKSSLTITHSICCRCKHILLAELEELPIERGVQVQATVLDRL